MKNYNNYIKEALEISKNTDFDGQYIDNDNDSYQYIGFNLFNVEDIFEEFLEIKKSDIENYITLDTLKNMFPIYKKFDFYKDWSVKIFKYNNYIILQKSGYYYIFEKK